MSDEPPEDEHRSDSADEAAVRAANQAFYAAFEARDLDAMSDVWEHADRISCTHPGWRTLHGLSYALYALSLAHGLFSGTDSGTVWSAALYWFTAVSLLGLTAYRVWVTKLQASKKTAKSVSRLAATSGQ